MHKKHEEHVPFVAREGVTLYTGRGATARAAGTSVQLPKSHAEALAEFHAPVEGEQPSKAHAETRAEFGAPADSE